MSKKSKISDEFKTQLDESPMDILMAPSTQKGEQSKRTKKNKIQSLQDKLKPNIKERMTVQIRQNVIERVKDAVYWTPGLTVAQFTEEALESALNKMEKQNGKPFQKRKAELKPGRPLS